MASLWYDLSCDGSSSAPVWLPEGEIVECFAEDFVIEAEDGRTQPPRANETDLLSVKLRRCVLVDPAT